MENERGDYMLQVNRTNNLKILKDITNIYPKINTIDGKVNVKQAIATANNEKFDKQKVRKNTESDLELERIEKIPFNSNDLIVMTVVKKILKKQFKQISIQIGEAINLIASWKKKVMIQDEIIEIINGF